jgi:hypothetical protein
VGVLARRSRQSLRPVSSRAVVHSDRSGATKKPFCFAQRHEGTKGPWLRRARSAILDEGGDCGGGRDCLRPWNGLDSLCLCAFVRNPIRPWRRLGGGRPGEALEAVFAAGELPRGRPFGSVRGREEAVLFRTKITKNTKAPRDIGCGRRGALSRRWAGLRPSERLPAALGRYGTLCAFGLTNDSYDQRRRPGLAAGL